MVCTPFCILACLVQRRMANPGQTPRRAFRLLLVQVDERGGVSTQHVDRQNTIPLLHGLFPSLGLEKSLLLVAAGGLRVPVDRRDPFPGFCAT